MTDNSTISSKEIIPFNKRQQEDLLMCWGESDRPTARRVNSDWLGKEITIKPKQEVGSLPNKVTPPFNSSKFDR